MATTLERKPDWIRVRWKEGEQYRELKQIMRGLDLHTVCEEARCPNISECWNSRTATFMILGDTCTRACSFCAVKSGRPAGLDKIEPIRVAWAVKQMGLRHAVITSVARDDLEDGGAQIFAETIRKVREFNPDCSIEVLIPDLAGRHDALKEVVAAKPAILNHNVETVPRLQRRVRPKARYERSHWVLRTAKQLDADILTKSGMMLGLGETWDEIVQTLTDMAETGVDIFTIGQYLRPSKKHQKLERYYRPEEFAELKDIGESLGIRHVESGPLVRSSYHARDQVETLQDKAE